LAANLHVLAADRIGANHDSTVGIGIGTTVDRTAGIDTGRDLLLFGSQKTIYLDGLEFKFLRLHGSSFLPGGRKYKM
jgi:hypothetical protein